MTDRAVHLFVPPPELASGRVATAPVLVVGAGPVGLATAIDLRLRGVEAVVVEEDDQVGAGSRAICWSKRTLEIFDRLGVGRELARRGVTWNRGKVFFRKDLVYAFDLLPEGGHAFPAFVNLQQHHAEEILVRRALEVGVDVRWKSRVAAVVPGGDSVRSTIETPAGRYDVEARWLVAADGVRSAVRKALGLGFQGQVFGDHFLIADVRMKSAGFPTERWFWFDPPFHPGGSALLHRQADDVWRIDLQLGEGADPEAERAPERVLPRLRAMLGPAVDFDLEWVSVYTFQCRRLERFVHGRVVFAGDSAHTVSPFGARGGNGGIQDADNLAWKLAATLSGAAPAALVASYDDERLPAADENIRHSTRSTDFITPKSAGSRVLREAVLGLAREHAFARRVVNSGRLSTPHVPAASPLATPDAERWPVVLVPGAPAADAPIEREGRRSWLLGSLPASFACLAVGVDASAEARRRLAAEGIPTVLVSASRGEASWIDVEGKVAERYGAGGAVYLLRPDQHVAARWRSLEPEAILRARDRALGRT